MEIYRALSDFDLRNMVGQAHIFTKLVGTLLNDEPHELLNDKGSGCNR